LCALFGLEVAVVKTASSLKFGFGFGFGPDFSNILLVLK
jgi:hypothetical protein